MTMWWYGARVPLAAPSHVRTHPHVHLAPSGRRGASGRLPRLVQAGLLILLVGALADLLYHGLPVQLEPVFGPDGFRAHLLTFVGMFVMLLGVVRQGSSSTHVRPEVRLHAHR